MSVSALSCQFPLTTGGGSVPDEDVPPDEEDADVPSGAGVPLLKPELAGVDGTPSSDCEAQLAVSWASRKAATKETA